MPAAATVAGRTSARLPWMLLLAVFAGAGVLWVSSPFASGSAASIAVLPFTRLDAAPPGDHFTEGIADSLATALARSPGLRVVARTPAPESRGDNADKRPQGGALGARVLVKGSVRGTPDHLTITARLVSSTSGLDLWSERWEGPATDAPLFEEHAVRSILKAVGLRYQPANRPPLR